MTIYNFDLAAPFARNAPSDQIEPFPDLDTGLGIAFTQSDGKPEMKGLNGLFQLLTVSILSLRQRGISLWVASEEYPAGSFSVEGSKLYQAKTKNTGKRPSTSQNDWMIFASISDIKVSTNGNLKKDVANDGGVTLTVPTATTEDRGVMRFATPTEVANKSNVAAAANPSNVATIAQSYDLGVGQEYTNVTTQRALNMDYTNNTGKPIFIAVTIQGHDASPSLYVDGMFIYRSQNVYDANWPQCGISGIIPNGSKYRITNETQYAGSIAAWTELR